MPAIEAASPPQRAMTIACAFGSGTPGHEAADDRRVQDEEGHGEPGMEPSLERLDDGDQRDEARARRRRKRGTRSARSSAAALLLVARLRTSVGGPKAGAF